MADSGPPPGFEIEVVRGAVGPTPRTGSPRVLSLAPNDEKVTPWIKISVGAREAITVIASGKVKFGEGGG